MDKLGFTDKHDFVKYRRVIRKEGQVLQSADRRAYLEKASYRTKTPSVFPLEKIFAPTNLDKSKLIVVVLPN